MAKSVRPLGAILILAMLAAAGWWLLRGAGSNAQPASPTAAADRPVTGSPPVASAAVAASETTESIDVAWRPLTLIAPGTVVGESAPDGFSHLVIRSHTRVADESAEKISDLFAHLASMLFTAVVADVRAEEDQQGNRRFRLARVATGTGVEIDGRWVIVSSDTQEQLGAALGFMERTALAGGEQQMAETRSVARSSTMAVIDFSSIRLLDGKHRDIYTRYAVLVNPQTGQLDTLVWQMLRVDGERETAPSEPLGPMVRLQPNVIDVCALHVDSEEFTLGVPTKRAFATQGPPQGGPTEEFPEQLRAVAAQKRLTPEAARALYQGLAELLWTSSGSR